MNTGRYGSSAVSVPIHAPPIPRARRISGATQQSEAPMPANIAANKERPGVSETMCLFLNQPMMRRIDPVPQYGVKG